MSKALNKHVLAALCATPLFLNMGIALADEMPAPAATEAAAPAEPAPPYTLTYNLGLYSNYMFRGVEYSDGPALQGGIDWAHSSGFYLGTWFSNLDPYAYGKNDTLRTKGDHLETDFYGGYAHTFENGFGINFLGNYYKYLEGKKANNILPSGDNRKHRFDTFEASIALSYSYFTYTYYNVLTDYYGLDKTDKNFVITGNRDTKGADYNELKFNYKLPIADLNFMAKVGYQHTPNLQGSEGDYAIGVNRDFSLPSGGKPITGFNAGAYFTNTFAVKNEDFYLTADGRDINEAHLWFYAKRTW